LIEKGPHEGENGGDYKKHDPEYKGLYFDLRWLSSGLAGVLLGLSTKRSSVGWTILERARI
jgi:hypothetical protein